MNRDKKELIKNEEEICRHFACIHLDINSM